MLDRSTFRSACALAFWICAASTIPAVRLAQPPTAQQKPAQPPASRAAAQPADQDQETAVRISTQLVQIDAVVTDKKGDHVENLTAEDLEMTVDGKRQAITYFKLVKLPEPKPAGPPTKENKPIVAPANLPGKVIEPEQVKRTIAFVVDDLGLSFESTYYARRALKKFVDEQM